MSGIAITIIKNKEGKNKIFVGGVIDCDKDFKEHQVVDAVYISFNRSLKKFEDFINSGSEIAVVADYLWDNYKVQLVNDSLIEIPQKPLIDMVKPK